MSWLEAPTCVAAGSAEGLLPEALFSDIIVAEFYDKNWTSRIRLEQISSQLTRKPWFILHHVHHPDFQNYI